MTCDEDLEKKILNVIQTIQISKSRYRANSDMRADKKGQAKKNERNRERTIKDTEINTGSGRKQCTNISIMQLKMTLHQKTEG